MRKWLPFICIVLLLNACVFGILYFLRPEKDTSAMEEPIANIMLFQLLAFYAPFYAVATFAT